MLYLQEKVNEMPDFIERCIAGPLAGDFEDIDAVFINGPRQSGKSTFAEAFGSRYEKVFDEDLFAVPLPALWEL
jgi:predicted AAA+ superfamily ATPase